MSNYPCKYLSTRKCCCCFNCDPRQVFLILSSTCLLLGLINMCSYPLCPAIIISSLVLAFYYFGAGIFLLYAVTGLHEKLLKTFPWLMLFSYIPIAAYIGCLVSSLDCIEKWTTHYSIDENSEYAKNMFIGITSLYSMFAVANFLFSTYALMLSMGQLEDNKSVGVVVPMPASQNPYAPAASPINYAPIAAPPTPVAMPPNPTPLATVITAKNTPTPIISDFNEEV